MEILKKFNFLYFLTILSLIIYSCNNEVGEDEQKPNKLVSVTLNSKIGDCQNDSIAIIQDDSTYLEVNCGELILYNPTGINKDTLLSEIRAELLVLGYSDSIQIVSTCKGCNDKLLLLKGVNLHKYSIKLSPGDGASCPNPKQACQQPYSVVMKSQLGKNDLLTNINLDNIDYLKKSFKISNKKLIVVLDTGLKPTDEYIENNKSSLVVENGKIGVIGINQRDTTDKSGEPEDSPRELEDSSESVLEASDGRLHGTKIVKIIQSQIGNMPNIKIIPIKITENCPGDLFNALCGLLVSSELNADLVNVSWTYGANYDVRYVSRNILREIKNKNPHLKIIAAAGNENIDLDNLKFRNYPACFNNEKEFRDMIFSVTSVWHKNLSSIKEIENYSESGRFVDVGVLCKSNSNKFPIPEANNYFSLSYGTSYATAYITGQIAKNNCWTLKKSQIYSSNRFLIHTNNIQNVPDYLYNPN
ncbi:MAG: hypothetical protein CFE22_06875 [Cytophagaceae bacterium BCCC1]|nr:MAG: hypothetical protein CFE22_06875 [Cytophagaceae bacterium BCCC1]